MKNCHETACRSERSFALRVNGPGFNPRVNPTEIEQAIASTANNKAAGLDGIPAEVYKHGGDTLVANLLDRYRRYWESGELPQHFKDALIVNIYKRKGDRQDCGNYRGISLMAIASKIFAKILLQRLLVVANYILPEAQCGFRSSRSTIDVIFTFRPLQEKAAEQNKPLYIAFVDFSKAFDSISHPCLWRFLSKCGCPDKFMLMLRAFHMGMRVQVMIDGETTDAFPVAHGVKPTLFTLFLAAVLHVSNRDATKGVYITTRSGGRFFNVSRLKAKTKNEFHFFFHSLTSADMDAGDDRSWQWYSWSCGQQLCDAKTEYCDPLTEICTHCELPCSRTTVSDSNLCRRVCPEYKKKHSLSTTTEVTRVADLTDHRSDRKINEVLTYVYVCFTLLLLLVGAMFVLLVLRLRELKCQCPRGVEEEWVDKVDPDLKTQALVIGLSKCKDSYDVERGRPCGDAAATGAASATRTTPSNHPMPNNVGKNTCPSIGRVANAQQSRSKTPLDLGQIDSGVSCDHESRIPLM
ncbi:hypothetical protein LSAT2_012515 [Lamellibrachia satsuma]|nr:hypothetical protein LSAT2_012515 [Lamellibrachia satsuma]